MLVGYARVSTLDQDPALQINVLRAAGWDGGQPPLWMAF